MPSRFRLPFQRPPTARQQVSERLQQQKIWITAAALIVAELGVAFDRRTLKRHWQARRRT